MTSGTTTCSAVLGLAPSAELIAAVKKNEAQLRMLPQTAVEAMRLSENPRCSIAEYTSLIERDVKLAADILGIANSATYCPTTRIVSLEQAVVRLGFRSCENLILASSVMSLMRRVSANHDHICGILWPHCHRTAFIAAKLNLIFGFDFNGEEFVAGLMHDFGRALLAVANPQLFAEADQLDFEEMPEQLLKEELAFGMNHCQFAAWYAREQNLPSPIPEVILHHHQPELARENQRLTALISVSDHMANHLQRFKNVAGYDPSENPYLPCLSKFAGASFENRLANIAAQLMEQAMLTAEM